MESLVQRLAQVEAVPQALVRCAVVVFCEKKTEKTQYQQGHGDNSP